jgi:hypothetical protein
VKLSRQAFSAILLTASATQIARTAELQPGTLRAWNAYLKNADLHMVERAARRLPFLSCGWMSQQIARLAYGAAKW